MGSHNLDLQHGHLGRLEYLDPGNTWWSQISDSAGDLSAFSAPQVHFSQSHDALEGGPKQRRDYDDESLFWRDLRRVDPTIVPVADHVRRLCRAEEARELSNQSPVAPTDRLLDTSLLRTSRDNSSKPLRLIAFVTANSNDVLALAVSRLCRRGWRDDQHTWMETGAPGEADLSSWNAGQGPIRQVCFHHIEGKSQDDPLLVVRFELSVVIIKPVSQGRGTKPILGWRMSSRYRIGLDQRKYPIKFWDIGTDIVDVALHPANPSVLVSVHRDGRFCVWNLNNPASKMSQAILVRQGNAKTPEDASIYPRDILFRAFWCQGGRKVAICGRYQIDVFDMTREQHHVLSHTFKDVYGLQTVQAAEQHPIDSSIFLVATATCVHLLSTRSEQNSIDGKPELELYEVLRWKHSLDARQSNLSLGFSRDNHGEKVLLSRADSPFILQYSLRRSRSSKGDLISVSLHPSLLATAQGIWTPRAVGLFSVPCSIVSADDNASESLGRHYREAGVQFWQAFVLDRTGSLKSFLYWNRSSSDHGSAVVETLAWATLEKGTRVQSERYFKESFVVDDDEDDDLNSSYADDTRATEFADQFRRLGLKGNNVSEDIRLQQTRSNEGLYELVTRVDTIDTDLETALSQELTQEYSKSKSTRASASLLSAHFGMLPLLRNIEAADQALKGWIQSHSPEPSSALPQSSNITGLPIPLLDGFHKLYNNDDEATILSLYRAFVEEWVRPLPLKAPSTARLAKERAARYVAASLSLSSIRIERQPVPEAGPDGLNLIHHDPNSSPPLDAPNPLLPDPKSPEKSPTDDPIAAAVTRLRRYAPVQQPPPPKPTFQPMLTRLLASWTPGASENDISLPPSFHQDIPGSRTDAESEARELRRLEKRKQAEASRRDMEAKRARLAMRSRPGFSALASSPSRAPPTWASSPTRRPDDRGRAGALPQDSAPAGNAPSQDDSLPAPSSQPVVASQVEPGKHGGRPLMGLPVRRKPRRPGF